MAGNIPPEIRLNLLDYIRSYLGQSLSVIKSENDQILCNLLTISFYNLYPSSKSLTVVLFDQATSEVEIPLRWCSLLWQLPDRCSPARELLNPFFLVRESIGAGGNPSEPTKFDEGWHQSKDVCSGMATREGVSGGKTSSYLVSDVFAKGTASMMAEHVRVDEMSSRVSTDPHIYPSEPLQYPVDNPTRRK